jgi:hypothetical protein
MSRSTTRNCQLGNQEELSLKTISLDRRMMDKIIDPVFTSYKTKSLAIIEPLHSTIVHRFPLKVLQGRFEIFAGRKFDGLASLNLNLLSRLWVSAFSGFPFC